MKPNFLFTSLAIGLIFFSSCDQAATQKVDLNQVKSEIQERENAWAAALNSKDLDALMALYTEDAVSMENNAPAQTGKAAIRSSQEKDFATWPEGMNFTFVTTEVYGEADKITETGTSTMKNAEGKVIGTGKYMCTWEKQDGQYLCSREIYNNDKPSGPAATKSIHLFDLPADVTEEDWSTALADMNKVIADMGYPGAGYHFYKTEDAETNEYRYYFEGAWPSEAAYIKIHEDPAFTTAGENLGPLYEQIKANQIYRRLNLVR
jgi:uncharacterized protein (TIGR02246 family)